MDEGDAVAIGRDQRPHDVHDGAADAARAQPRRREHDDLRLALSDRVGDAGLMQAGIRRLTRIDLAQVADIGGHHVPAARGGRARHRCTGDREGVDGQSRGLNPSVTLLREYFKAPGAGPLKGDLRDVDALHIGRPAVYVPGTVGMDVHVVPLLDDLQRVVERLRLRRELHLLATNIIRPHGDPGIGEEPVVLQEPEGEPILADHQLGGRDQYLQRSRRQWGELGRRGSVTLGEARGDHELQRDQTRDYGPVPARPSIPCTTPQ